MAVALKLEEERKAGESARLAKAEQHRAVQQQQKQIAQEVRFPHSRNVLQWLPVLMLHGFHVFRHVHIVQICG